MKKKGGGRKEGREEKEGGGEIHGNKITQDHNFLKYLMSLKCAEISISYIFPYFIQLIATRKEL